MLMLNRSVTNRTDIIPYRKLFFLTSSRNLITFDWQLLSVRFGQCTMSIERE